MQTAPHAPSELLDELSAHGIKLWLDAGKLRCAGPDAVLTPEVQARIAAQRDGLVALLSTVAAAPALAQSDTLLLSHAQQRLWFMEQLPGSAGLHNVPHAVRIDGFLDGGALGQALSVVIERHEVLRTRYVATEHDTVSVLVDPPAPLAMQQVDLRHAQGNEQQVAQLLREQVEQTASATFDLTRDWPIRAQLIRLGTDAHVLCLTLHHIACDAWSLELLMAELGQAYQAALTGAPAALPALPMQYTGFAAWQRQRLRGDTLASQLVYWRTQLGGELPALDLPTDRPRARMQSSQGAVAHFRIEADLAHALRALSRQQGATLFMTLLAAYQLLLSRCTGQRDVLVGVPVANRQLREVEPLIGLFVNTLVMRARIDPTQDFTALLAQVRQTTLQALAHQDLPFEQLIEALQPERDLSRHALFQAKFRLENAPPPASTLPGLNLSRLSLGTVRAKLDLSADLYDTGEAIVGGFEYNSDLFDADTMARLTGLYLTLLRGLVTQPGCDVASLPLLGADEARQQRDWNTTAQAFRPERAFHHAFEEQARLRPDAPALVFDGGRGNDDVHTLSYAALNARANRLAHHLRAQGTGPEQIIAICLPRGLDMVIAMLGVLKAGAAYLPIDPAYPAERMAYMLADSGARLVLTHQGHALPDLDTQITARLDLDATTAFTHEPSGHIALDPAPLTRPEHLAYVIYTSGTTGRPKGVMIEHGGLVNLVDDKIRMCDVRAGDRVLQFFSFGFDAAVPEIVMALASGASLLLAPAERLLPGPGLGELIQRHHVTHLTMTPSALADLPRDDYPDLRMVLVGGEAPAPELITHWSRGRRFINAYGPTETTVNASMVPCGNGQPLDATLWPAANKQLHVVDEHLQRLPVGLAGELCIGGVGLARGYLNRAALTTEQFIPNPWHDTADPTSSERLYRTGDLACRLPDGRIRLLGRIDHQVKVRGFRVEPAEIEQVLARHPAVSVPSVIAVHDPHGGGKRLLAFAVPTGNASDITPAEIRQHLAEHLPAYMVPATFRWIEALPLTPHGKIDTARLQDLADAPTAASSAPLHSETEQALAAVFAEILSVPVPQADADFFELGGHSLLATRLVSRMRQSHGIELTVIDLFEAPTLSALARRIDHRHKLARLARQHAPTGATQAQAGHGQPPGDDVEEFEL